VRTGRLQSTLHAATMFALCALVLSANVDVRAGQSTAALRGVPAFQADPKWPVLPTDWTWGQVIGIFADARGHVWTSSRGRISEWDPEGSTACSWITTAMCGRTRGRAT
jgi:hypothetical protein